MFDPHTIIALDLAVVVLSLVVHAPPSVRAAWWLALSRRDDPPAAPHAPSPKVRR